VGSNQEEFTRKKEFNQQNLQLNLLQLYKHNPTHQQQRLSAAIQKICHKRFAKFKQKK
jgi:hypothetical protein